MNQTDSQRLGPKEPRLTLYIPHRPAGLGTFAQPPKVADLLTQNSNHWRKIITLAAKVAAPDADWQHFRDQHFFDQVALVFSSELEQTPGWHWIGGKENQARFGLQTANLPPLPKAEDLFIDPARRLLLTPYPDYRQLSNRKVALIRQGLLQRGFYPGV
ncbi:DUF6942 family protein [Marinobacterium sp. YM272]|uniref:DUF6942 family protein n=1 Tax=Marinobacterium sp. YM272 TaxID=3421654 RepID=UPI003D7F5D41